MEIKHPDHPSHGLKHSPETEPFECNACKELGFGRRYECKIKSCTFRIHEDCFPLHGPLSHPLFPGCTLLFVKESKNRVCDACGKSIKGIAYRCTHKNSKKAHDIHPCCLTLPLQLTGEGGVHLHLENEVSSKCGKCMRKEAAVKVKGWSYTDNRKHCYHVACVKDMVLEKYNEGCFNGAETKMGYDLALPTARASASASSGSNALARKTMFGEKTKTFLKIVNVVLKLIISAIFGSPTGVAEILIESFF